MSRLSDALIEEVRRFDAVDLGRVKSDHETVIALDTARSQADPEEFYFQGNYLYCDDDTTGTIYVRFGDKDAPRWKLSSAAGIFAKDYQRVFIDHVAQAGKVASIKWGLGTGITPPTLVGNVGSVQSILDPVNARSEALERAMIGELFIGSVSTSPSGSDYAVTALINDSADKNLIVVSANFTTVTTGYFYLFSGTQADIEAEIGATTWGQNAVSGGADSTRGKLDGAQVANAPSTYADTLARYYNSASDHNIETIHHHTGGIIVPPDRGIFLGSSAVNASLTSNFVWWEDPI